MAKHFLVAVSEQASALHGIRFLNHFFSDKRSIKSTLFYSGPRPHVPLEDHYSLRDKALHKEEEKQLIAAGRRAIETAAAKSVSYGFLRKNISGKLHSSPFSTVSDIIREGEAGRYDAVVLGRRSFGLLEAALESSVSRSLFNQSFRFPLWLCRSIEGGRRNVLLYGDGGEMSFHAADHVGRILGTEKRHRVDVLLEKEVWKDGGAGQRYVSVLTGHGVDPDRIGLIENRHLHTAAYILKLAGEENYAAVAIGRGSPQKHIFERLFKDHVASVLFRELKHAALWICH